MKFLIQKIHKEIRHDFSFGLLEAIRYQKWYDPAIKFQVKYLDYIENIPEPDDIYPLGFKTCHSKYVPVGSVEFVTDYLETFFNLTPKPRNIPVSLIPFAQRNVIHGTEREYNLIEPGQWFIKSDDQIKAFSGWFNVDGSGKLEKKGNYQYSSFIDIDSEWRAFVYENKLVGLQNYGGDFTIFPDVKQINKMIGEFYFHNEAPIAYTLDVGVNDRGTFVIEVHDFFSCGLYGFDDYRILPQMLHRWFEEYLFNNIKENGNDELWDF